MRTQTRNSPHHQTSQGEFTPLVRLRVAQSPSQCPGTARSATSAGRSLIKIMSGIFPDGPAAVDRLGRRTARPVRKC